MRLRKSRCKLCPLQSNYLQNVLCHTNQCLWGYCSQGTTRRWGHSTVDCPSPLPPHVQLTPLPPEVVGVVTEKMEAEQLATSKGTPVAAESRPSHTPSRTSGPVPNTTAPHSKTRLVLAGENSRGVGIGGGGGSIFSDCECALVVVMASPPPTPLPLHSFLQDPLFCQ